jgi:hypothetical protein
MSTQVNSIEPLGDNRYEVVVVGDSGTEHTVICTVVSGKGVSGIQLSPDNTMGPEGSPFDVRVLSGAVVNFHERRAASSVGKHPHS